MAHKFVNTFKLSTGRVATCRCRRYRLPLVATNPDRSRRVADHTGGVGSPEGFTFTVRKNGEVVIRHHGQVATTLRGTRATAFVTDVGNVDDQALMARMTGNYKRGNERASANHVRNRRR